MRRRESTGTERRQPSFDLRDQARDEGNGSHPAAVLLLRTKMLSRPGVRSMSSSLRAQASETRRPVHRSSQTTIRSTAGDPHSRSALSSTGRKKSFGRCSSAGATTPTIGFFAGKPSVVLRSLARGERLEPRAMYAKTLTALKAVVAAGVERATAPQNGAASNTERTSSLDHKLWREMLSSAPRTALRLRLKAFEALEKADAFRRCACGGPEPKRQLSEEKFDAACAYLVRLAGGRHYRAAIAAVEFPEVYLAVRDALDAEIRSST